MSESVTLKRKRVEDDADGSIAKRLCKDVTSGSEHDTIKPTSDKGKQKALPIDSEAETSKGKGSALENDSRTEKLSRNATRVPFKPRPKIVKLTPHRPYPTVPTSSSATGPRSKRTEGNNKICVTRRTELGAYLSRCKDVFVKQGYKELYLSAMGAAIPHAVMLATSLPAILPFHQREIKTTVTTGSVKVTDEVVPVNDDDEDETRTRIKASIEIIIRVGSEQGIEAEVVDTDSFSE